MSDIRYLNLNRRGPATLSSEIESRNHVTLKVIYCKGKGKESICFGRTIPSKFFSFGKIDFVIYKDKVYLSGYSYSGNKIIRGYNEDYLEYKKILDEKFLEDRVHSTTSLSSERSEITSSDSEDEVPEVESKSATKETATEDGEDEVPEVESNSATRESAPEDKNNSEANHEIKSVLAKFENKYAAIPNVRLGHKKDGIIEFEATFPILFVLVEYENNEDDIGSELMTFKAENNTLVYDGTIDSEGFNINRSDCIVAGFYSDKFLEKPENFKKYLEEIEESITKDSFASGFNPETEAYTLPISKNNEHFVTFSKTAVKLDASNQ